MVVADAFVAHATNGTALSKQTPDQTMKYRILLLPAMAALLAACDANVTVPPKEGDKTTIVNPPAEKKVENNTTIVNPPAEKKVEHNTTIVTPAAPAPEKK